MGAVGSRADGAGGLADWVRARGEQSRGPVRAAGLAARDPSRPAVVRSVLALLVDEGGIVARGTLAEPLSSLEREQRRRLSKLKVRIGALDLFMPDMLKPEAMRWRTALRCAASKEPMPALPRSEGHTSELQSLMRNSYDVL